MHIEIGKKNGNMWTPITDEEDLSIRQRRPHISSAALFSNKTRQAPGKDATSSRRAPVNMETQHNLDLSCRGHHATSSPQDDEVDARIET